MVVSTILNGPTWFFGIDSILEIVSTIIALMIFGFSFKMYRFNKDERFRAFSFAFGFLTLAFLARALTNLVLHSHFLQTKWQIVRPDFDPGRIITAQRVFVLGYLAHIFLTLFAYIILLALQFEKEHKKIALVLGSMSLVILISSSYFTSFYFLSLVLLGFITYNFYMNFRKTKNANAKLVVISFIMIFFANLQFLLQLWNPAFYVTSYLTLFVGFITLGLTLYKVTR